jgi:isopentenyldiphosphate isomerase
VLLFNTGGELYVTRRSPRKDVYPSLCDVVTSGVVSAGESYEETAERELKEEVGIAVGPHAPLERLCTFRWTDAYCRVWGAAFRARCDAADVTHADGEVTSGEWVALADVAARVAAAPNDFTPVGRYVLATFMQQQRAAQRATAARPPERRRCQRGGGKAC